MAMVRLGLPQPEPEHDMTESVGRYTLTLFRGYQSKPSVIDPEALPFDTVTHWLRGGDLPRHILRFESVRLRVPVITAMSRPLATALLVRVLARGECVIEDDDGRRWHVGPRLLLGLAARLVLDAARVPALLRGYRKRVAELAANEAGSRALEWDLGRPPLYITPVMAYGMQSGGIIGHTAGVLNVLDRITQRPIWVTTDEYDGVRADIERCKVEPSGRYADFAELPWFAFNDRVTAAIRLTLGARKPAFIYQRSFAGAIAGAEMALELAVPYVLEFNSSVVSFSRMWADPIRFEGIIRRVERTTLRLADLVVVVSEPLRDQVVGLGVSPTRVLVNPNGVDLHAYSPSVDGSRTRDRLGIRTDEFVIGFVGTFYLFHGLDVLVDAFATLLATRSGLRERLRLLLVGDGPLLQDVSERVARAGISDRVLLTGATTQSDGPAHMAACDVLTAPYIPNSDGSAFWGSPVKVFEYMAMGKPIVASQLGQITELLRHAETGILVEPGDANELAHVLGELADQPDICHRLGEAARAEAVTRHSWEAHTRRIVERLEAICG
jgi:glycosyltransferase involved in cell wall biosynthesis